MMAAIHRTMYATRLGGSDKYRRHHYRLGARYTDRIVNIRLRPN